MFCFGIFHFVCFPIDFVVCVVQPSSGLAVSFTSHSSFARHRLFFFEFGQPYVHCLLWVFVVFCVFVVFFCFFVSLLFFFVFFVSLLFFFVSSLFFLCVFILSYVFLLFFFVCLYSFLCVFIVFFVCFQCVLLFAYVFVFGIVSLFQALILRVDVLKDEASSPV